MLSFKNCNLWLHNHYIFTIFARLIKTIAYAERICEPDK